MIRRLRRRHLAHLSLLAIVVPVGYVASLLVRESVPRMTDLPAFADPEIRSTAAGVVWKRDDLWDDLPLTATLLRSEEGAILLVRPERDLALPEVLAYWAPEGPDTGSLPGAAVLLGTLAGTASSRFALPAVAGRLILYSLGHQEIVGVARLPES